MWACGLLSSNGKLSEETCDYQDCPHQKITCFLTLTSYNVKSGQFQWCEQNNNKKIYLINNHKEMEVNLPR